MKKSWKSHGKSFLKKSGHPDCAQNYVILLTLTFLSVTACSLHSLDLMNIYNDIPKYFKRIKYLKKTFLIFYSIFASVAFSTNCM